MTDGRYWQTREQFLEEAALRRDLARRYSAEVDPETGSVYVRIRRGKITRTIGVTSSVNLDVDRWGRVVGVEVL